MKVKASAPARIDLAGGTLDLWPLYLFFENTATINCAINQVATVELETGGLEAGNKASGITLVSRDHDVAHAFESYGELLEAFEGGHKATKLPPALWLHAKVVRHFLAFWRKSASLKVTTRCAAPAGAGLGGSSALNIALCAALRSLTLANVTDEELTVLARDLETTVIEVPAGIQDYWSAVFGGVCAIRMEAGRIHRKVFYKQAKFVEDHLILCHSKQSRNSGINNWAVYKGFIDGDANIKNAFQQIVKATYKVEEALESQSFEKFSEGISMEWKARKKLCANIATQDMQTQMEKAMGLGAKAAKVCGAGGGGCYIIVAPADQKTTITQKLEEGGVHVIPFKVVDEGCKVSSVNAGNIETS